MEYHAPAILPITIFSVIKALPEMPAFWQSGVAGNVGIMAENILSPSA
jgi:hypothetical protein